MYFLYNGCENIWKTTLCLVYNFTGDAHLLQKITPTAFLNVQKQSLLLCCTQSAMEMQQEDEPDGFMIM